MAQVDFLALSDFLYEVTPMFRAPARPAQSWDAAAPCSVAICHHSPVVDARLSLDRPPGPQMLSVGRFDTRRETWCAVLDGDPQALPERAPEWVDASAPGGGYVGTTRLYEFDDGRRFVLPLVFRRGPVSLGGWLGSCGIGGQHEC